MENKQKNQLSTLLNHNLELISRKKLHITGVNEVISATDKLISLKTECGPLSITGTDLKIINLFNVDKKVDVEGEINEIKYTEKKKKFFDKVFK